MNQFNIKQIINVYFNEVKLEFKGVKFILVHSECFVFRAESAFCPIQPLKKNIEKYVL
jgi:hypothetical protein